GQVESIKDSIKDETVSRFKSAAIDTLKSGLGGRAEDTTDLAKNVAYQRCMANVPVVIFDRMVCDDLRKAGGKEPEGAGGIVFQAVRDNAATGRGEADVWNDTVAKLGNPGPLVDQALDSLGKK